MGRRNNKITLKPYDINQLRLPMSLDDIIPEKHLVRTVNDAIEKIDLELLLSQYKPGGTSIYHPKMMLKIIVFAYTQRIYSARQIAKALRENIHFMWISGGNTPDFRTINNFRNSIMKDVLDHVFSSVIEMLVEGGFVSLENYFLDGTKIEANANKYSWVWAKSTNRYKLSLQKKIAALLYQIDQVNDQENKAYKDKDLEELGLDIDSEKLEKKMKEFEEKFGNSKKKDLNKLKKEYLPKLKKYEDQQKKLNHRNSYSKTDIDSTFMRMKDDHMRNGQLKPAYNVQIGTENQFILGYSIHQRPGDTGCLIPHLNKVKNILKSIPPNIIADSGYGSEENYCFLQKENLTPYVKYNYFHREQKNIFKNDIFRVENLIYDHQKDEFTCPNGKKLTYQYTQKQMTDNGFKTKRKYYQCESCEGCGFKGICTKSDGDRKIQVSFRLRSFKNKVRSLLNSDKGKQLRSKRPIEVEAVFGQLKNNKQIRRFHLRGLKKVETEFGIHCLAHNLAKLATQ